MTEQEMDKLLSECHVWGSYEGEPSFIYNALQKAINLEKEQCAKICDKIFDLSNNLAASQCAWEIRKKW